MSLFSKLFGNSSKQETHSDNPQTNMFSDINSDVFENLFINSESPVVEQDAAREEVQSIGSYIEQDFYKKGYEDGYDGHTAEVLEHKIRSIRADFRYQLSIKVDALQQDLVMLGNQKIEIDGMSVALTAQLDNRMNLINKNIQELKTQIELSSVDEGMVMVAIHKYRDGFIKGTGAYQMEKNIGISTGLFN